MFVSSREFQDYINRDDKSYIPEIKAVINAAKKKKTNKSTNLSLQDASKFMAILKRGIVDRKTELDVGDDFYNESEITDLYKWYRPWEIVPALKNFKPPKGDFGVGVEIEFGFTSKKAAQTVAGHIANWKYIALDFEGGTNPIEVTFPPILYSKLNSQSQCMRYLDYLASTKGLVTKHSAGNGSTYSKVGTHINVSMGAIQVHKNWSRLRTVNDILRGLTPAQNRRYFGRRPYNYGYSRSCFIEWKLFNSVVDSKRLRQYIDIAVELTRLIGGSAAITEQSVNAALETGFNKSLPKRKVA